MKVRINLVAMTREEMTTEVEVSDTMTDSDLDDLVRDMYTDSDGSEFITDMEYWEKGHCSWEKLPKSEEKY